MTLRAALVGLLAGLAIAASTLAAAAAEPVVVRSGEHDGFSRIVLPLPGARRWVFGKAGDGYELRFDGDETLDLSGVFRRIGRGRVAALVAPGPGRLRLRTACDCAVAAFDLPDGRIVIDVGAADAGVAEAVGLADLPPLADGVPAAFVPEGSPPPRIAAAPAAPVPVDPDPGPVVKRPGADAQAMPRRARAALARPVAAGGSGRLPAGIGETGGAIASAGPDRFGADRSPEPIPARDAGPDPAGGQPLDVAATLAEPVLKATAPGLPALAAAAPAPDHEASPPAGAADRGAATAVAPASPTARPRPVSADEIFPLPGTILTRDLVIAGRVDAAQTALLEQLQRAASQGLVVVEGPEPALPAEVEPPAAAADVAPAANLELPGQPHLKVDTAVDRDNRAITRTPLTPGGQTCLPDALFDLASWGDGSRGAHGLGDLRGQILGEFDRPDPKAVIALARRLAYLGFGAETRALLSVYPVASIEAQAVVEIADVIDEVPGAGRGLLATQSGCATGGALWGALAVESISPADTDRAAVLRAFSALPVHLRRHLGPRLAARFLAAGDEETAASLRNLMQRALPDDDAAVVLTSARLDATVHDVAASREELARVVADNGSDSGIALAELLEAQLSGDEAIDPGTVRLADAMAVEHRGTPLGRRLSAAAIRALAATGEVATTFQRIVAARKSGDLAPDVADGLFAEAHLANAARSDDATFLLLSRRYPLTDTPSSGVSADARRAVAGRLNDLGLAEDARRVLAPMSGDDSPRTRLLMARIDLATDRLDAALEDLAGLTGEDVESVRAQVLDRKGDLVAAAAAYLEAGDEDAALSAIWRAGDLGAVAERQEGTRAALASAILGGPAAPASSPPASPDGAEDRVSLAENRALVDRSRKTRVLLEELLK